MAAGVSAVDAGGGDSGRAAAALALGVGLLALVRFLWLGEWGLWIDEAHTLHDAMAGTAASQGYPLGYWMTQGVVWVRGGAVDEVTLRLAPALFGALGLPLAFWTFAPAVGRTRALAAALILGASAWHLFWSQSARAYTLALDLSLLGGGFYLRGLLFGRGRVLASGFALGVLAAFAHPSAALMLPGWVLAPIALPWFGVRLALRPPRRLVVAIAALGGLVLFGWALRVIADYWDAKSAAEWLPSWKHFALSTGFYVTPWLGAGALLGALMSLRHRNAFGLLAALVVATVLATALSMALVVRVSAQYVFVLLPWFAALATVPLAGAAPRRWRLAYGALLVVPGLVDVGLYFGPRHGNRPRWREAYAHVFDQRAEHDLVFGMAAVVGQYYLDPGSRSLRDHRDLVRLNSYTAEEPARWARRGRRMWFVVRREDLLDWPSEDRAAFEVLLAEECRRTLTLPVRYTPRDLSLEVHVREPWAAGGRP